MKYVVIGLSRLEFDMERGTTRPGGELLRLALSLASGGGDVCMVSEASLDPVGDTLAAMLREGGVDVASVDRYGDGVTPLLLNFGDGRVVEYVNHATTEFDTVWPRIDKGDIVVFGGRFVIEDRVRRQLVELLDYARTRKAIIVYIPWLESYDVPRATRVMPAVLDNLDLADAAIVRPSEMKLLYGEEDTERCYRYHIAFHCSDVAVAADGEMTLYPGGARFKYGTLADVLRTLVGSEA